MKDANVTERFFQGAGDRGLHHRVSIGQPLLEDAARAQSPVDGGVELLRIEQTRPSRFDRRRRIDGDDVVLRGSAFQVAASVIDHDV
jgi:hypothetical protein